MWLPVSLPPSSLINQHVDLDDYPHLISVYHNLFCFCYSHKIVTIAFQNREGVIFKTPINLTVAPRFTLLEKSSLTNTRYCILTVHCIIIRTTRFAINLDFQSFPTKTPVPDKPIFIDLCIDLQATILGMYSTKTH
jgi:hypothetical protein